MVEKIKIGLDGKPLCENQSGISRYVYEICMRLDHLMPEVEFFLYCPKPLKINPPSFRWKPRIDGSLIHRGLSSYAWLKLRVGSLCQKDGVALFWATRTILPRVTPGMRTVATVHDLNYCVYPETMPRVTLWAQRLWFRRSVNQADAVVVNSAGTGQRLLEFLGKQADAIARPGVSSSFGPQSTRRVDQCLQKLGIKRPYFLAVGTLEPRKNLQSLVNAFIQLQIEGRIDNHKLIIVGRNGWRNNRERRLIEKSSYRGVHWIGYIEDDKLAALYAGATAFVFPSLYEGFGIPALEATACRTRLIASDIPELREAGGEAGLYISPTVEGIKAGLLQVLETWQSTDKIKQPCSTWDSASHVMARVFNGLIGTPI